jgi:hypothetical protein
VLRYAIVPQNETASQTLETVLRHTGEMLNPSPTSI